MVLFERAAHQNRRNYFKNIAWERSFARVEQNKKAIVERGWNPLNYNLLTNSELRATMTVAEKLTESSKTRYHHPLETPMQILVMIVVTGSQTHCQYLNTMMQKLLPLPTLNNHQL